MPGDPPTLEPGLLVGGRYRLERPLGRGGFGAVYRASELPTERQVAIKILTRDEPGPRQRLLREARLASQVEDDRLVRVLDAGEDEVLGVPFVVFELVRGQTLARLVARAGGLSERAAAALLAQVAGALGRIHRLEIVHRDLKPENLMVSERAGRPHVTVLDFGAARGPDGVWTALTAPGGLLGTPHFMSPEQAAGGTALPASDLYALGATAYFALTGAPPFGDRKLAELLGAHLAEAPPPLPARLVDGAAPSPGLRALITALLEKSPLARPADAELTARLFEALARGEAPDVPEALAEARRQAFARTLPPGESLATNPAGRPQLERASAEAPAAVPAATTVRDAPAARPRSHADRRALLAADTLDPAPGTPLTASLDLDAGEPAKPTTPERRPSDSAAQDAARASSLQEARTAPEPRALAADSALDGPRPPAGGLGPGIPTEQASVEPAPPHPVAAPRPAAPLPPAPRSPMRTTGVSPRTPSPVRSRLALLVAFVLLAGLVASLAVTVAGHAPSPGPAAPSTPTPPKGPRPTVAPRALPSVEVVSTPSGAEVFVEGRSLGRTPVVLPPEVAGAKAILRRAGYEASEVRLEAGRTQVRLQALPTAPARSTPGARPAAPDAGPRFEAW